MRYSRLGMGLLLVGSLWRLAGCQTTAFCGAWDAGVRRGQVGWIGKVGFERSTRTISKLKGRYQSIAARERCSSVPDLLLLSKSMSHASSDLDGSGVRGRRLPAAKPRATSRCLTQIASSSRTGGTVISSWFLLLDQVPGYRNGSCLDSSDCKTLFRRSPDLISLRLDIETMYLMTSRKDKVCHRLLDERRKGS